MTVLWFVVLVTQVVGLVLETPTQASVDMNDTQPIYFGEQPLSDGRRHFGVRIFVDYHSYVPQAAFPESLLPIFGSLAATPYQQYMGSHDYTPSGQRDLSTIVTEYATSERSLTVAYTMKALFCCFAMLDLEVPRPHPLYFNAIQCPFGFAEVGRPLFTPVGNLTFAAGHVGGSATSSGSPISVPNVSVTRRIKQRANAAPAALVDPASNITDQDPVAAASNAIGEQGPSSLGNFTSRPEIAFKLRGDGAIIPADQLLICTLGAVIDRAAQPRDGPFYARTYTPYSLGDYLVQSRGAPGVSLTYPTFAQCFLGLVKYLRDSHQDIHEGDWICELNHQDAMLGRFTKKPGGNAGIAAPPMNETLDSVDVSRRSHQ